MTDPLPMADRSEPKRAVGSPAPDPEPARQPRAGVGLRELPGRALEALADRIQKLLARARLPLISGTAPEAISARYRRLTVAAASLRLKLTPLVRLLAPHARRVLEVGTGAYPAEIKRRLMILNFIAYLMILSTVIYAVQYALLDYERYRLFVLLNLLIASAIMLVPFAHRINEIAAPISLLAIECAALPALMALLGRDSGVHMQFFVVAVAAFIVLGLERLWLVLTTVAVALGVHLVSWFSFPPHSAIVEVAPDMIASIYVQAAITTMALIAAAVWYAFSLVEQARAETDRLLRNILPDPIVDRLKANPDRALADAYDEVGVIFADLSGFVALARELGPERLVALLNLIVRDLDMEAERLGMEKIKTIGDAYMAAAGVPLRKEDNVGRMADYAFSVIRVVENHRRRTGLPLAVRIGAASGPAMAGVIGTRKFSYDIWGDTVNLAARLEAQSEPGRILICPQSAKTLTGRYKLLPHDTIVVRGIGPVETWWLEAPLIAPPAASLSQLPLAAMPDA